MNDSPASLTIVDPGPSTTLQDGGRLNSIEYGVSPSGAIDRRAMRVANERTSNPPESPIFESLLGGLSFRLDDGRWCAIAGARATVRVDGETVPDPELFWAPGGALIEIDEAAIGLYTVLAIAGGFANLSRTLGSVSTDTLSGIGHGRLQAGDKIDLGDAAEPCREAIGNVSLPADRAEIRFYWGPRDGVFDEEDRRLLLSTEWQVSNDTNRVGARLDGARLRGGDGSRPSEGIVSGSIQIPPSGQPIVFLSDRPVTGGYPIIGVVDEDELGLFAQLRPGTHVRFRPVG